MKFTISRNQLLPALQIVNGVVERRQTLPILSHTLLAISEERLSLTATDMEVELVSSVDAPFDTSGEITLPARKLFDICKALPEDAELTINVDSDKTQLVSGKSRFTLSTLPAQEFPLVELEEVVARFNINQGEFKRIIDKTSFAMAHQDVRYYLNGLLLEVNNNHIKAVATDGHRLALAEMGGVWSVEQPAQVIVPRKGVTELSRLLKDVDTEIEVMIGTNHIRVAMEGLLFTSKLVDGKFPDYSKVIPPALEQHVTADRELLRQSLTRASILSNEKYRGVRIVLEKDRLRALAHNPEQEEAEEEIEVEYSGKEIEIGFNVSYLLDALNIVKTDKVELTITDPSTSCLILPSGETGCQYVVMPMRL